MTALAVVGIVTQVVVGTTDLPFQRLVTLDGVGGSKIEYLEDPVVREQLLRHHVTLRLTRLGSRESTRVLSPEVDFYFPSGQPAAELVTRRRQVEQAYSSPHRVFVSPIVLATYREYAETLRAAGIATPQANQDPALPQYYDLDLARFIGLTRDGRSWDDLGIAAQGFTNGNTVLAQTTDICSANSAASYLGLVAYVTRGDLPESERAAVDLALQIKPLLREQSLPTREATGLYFIPEGRDVDAADPEGARHTRAGRDRAPAGRPARRHRGRTAAGHDPRHGRRGGLAARRVPPAPPSPPSSTSSRGSTASSTRI